MQVSWTGTTSTGVTHQCPRFCASSFPGLLGFHPSLLSGSSAAPSPSWHHKCIWAICVLKTREDIPAFPLPHVLSCHSSENTQKNRLQFIHRAIPHFTTQYGAQFPSKNIWGPLKTECQSQKLRVSFCLASVRANMPFINVHGKVSHKSLVQI